MGRRELLKLDLVEARLRRVGPPFEPRMAQLADELAAALDVSLRSMSPQTLVFIFGDHGFRLPVATRGAAAGSTLPATQGSASPEEVLVPAYAWLVGKAPEKGSGR